MKMTILNIFLDNYDYEYLKHRFSLTRLFLPVASVPFEIKTKFIQDFSFLELNFGNTVGRYIRVILIIFL